MATDDQFDAVLRAVWAPYITAQMNQETVLRTFFGEPGQVISWKPIIDPDLELDEGL